MTKVSEYLVVAFVVTPKQIARNFANRIRRPLRNKNKDKRHEHPKTTTHSSPTTSSSSSPPTTISSSNSPIPVKQQPTSNSASSIGDAPVPGSNSQPNVSTSEIGSGSNLESTSTSNSNAAAHPAVLTSASASTKKKWWRRRHQIPTVVTTAPNSPAPSLSDLNPIDTAAASAAPTQSPSSYDRKFKSSPCLNCVPGTPDGKIRMKRMSKNGFESPPSSVTGGRSRRRSWTRSRSRSPSPKRGGSTPLEPLPRYMVRTSYIDPVLADTLRERREVQHSGEIPAPLCT